MYLRIARHLAAKTGTNSAVLFYKSSLLIDGCFISWTGVIFSDFVLIRATFIVYG